MKTFYILDFDRCLGNTDAIQMLLEKVMTTEFNIPTDTFREARAAMEGVGKTFTTIRHIHELLNATSSTKTWEDIRLRLVTAAQSVDLLLPDARTLLSILDERQLPYGIITYGVEEPWQLTKLEIAGLLDVPHLVTKIETKGELLTGWKQPDETFMIPPALTRRFEPLTVEEVVLVDDKARSFWNIPDGVRGIHVVAPGGNHLPAQQGDIPSSVTDVTGLGGAIQALFG